MDKNRYRLLVNGRNYLLDRDGKPKKYGFYQNVYIEADNPRQAQLLVTSKLLNDKGLKEQVLNSESDPPKVVVETYWELDSYDYVGKYLKTDRTFYEQKKWWQFWKKI